MTITTIKKLEETIINKALNIDCKYECTYYDQYKDSYILCLLCDNKWVNSFYKKLSEFLHETKLDEFFTADYGQMSSDYENAKMVCVYFNNAIYPNQISEIIKIAGKKLNLEVEDKPLQGLHMLTDGVDFNTGKSFTNKECIVDDWGEYDEDLYTIRYVHSGGLDRKAAKQLKFINKKRKFNLPEGLSWDTRNTVLNNKAWFNSTLIKNGKTTSTKTKTVKAGMEVIAKNRIEEGIWTQTQADTYLNSYNEYMELGWTVNLAKYFAKEGPRIHKNTDIVSVTQAVTPTVNTLVKSVKASGLVPKSKRKYDLPKYVCYDMAESRNREHNVFQTQLRINGKLYKNNLPTVKEATLWVMNKMLETNQWTLQQASDYLATYKPEMENGNFIPSNTPKSPCWRKREKNKNIKAIKQKITDKLKDIFAFAEQNDIKIDVNVK